MKLCSHNIEELKRDPIIALDKYDPPSDWNMELHKDLIKRRKQFSTPIEVIDADKDFLRDLKELLSAWKVGKRRARIVNMRDFEYELKETAQCLDDLRDYRIENIKLQDRKNVACRLWKIIKELEITTAERSRLVSGSKAIHHLLPDLVPPMDTDFTARFFRGKKGFRTTERSFFLNVYPQFAALACYLTQDETLMKRVSNDFNTSIPKTLDNTIIGYVNLKRCTEPKCVGF